MIISTGSGYPKATFSGIGEKVINPTEALRLKEIPRSMVIVGGGFIGVTLATIFSKLGAKVTVVEESPRLLRQTDREIVAILEKQFKDNNVQIYFRSRVMSLAAGKEDDLIVLIDHKGEEVTTVTQYALMSEGREANIKELGLKERSWHPVE